MINPFRYGVEVTGDYFCNRKKELKDILSYFKDSQNTLIYSPRRYGKSSFIYEAITQIDREKFFVVYCDLYTILTEADFARVYLNAFSKSIADPLEKTYSIIKKLFKALRPQVTFDDQGHPQFSLKYETAELSPPALEEIIEVVPRYISRAGQKGIVIFDEFQQVGELATDRLEKVLRSRIQKHHNICYIFMGSKKRLLFKMFADPHRPFYKSVAHYPFEKIPSEELAKFIVKRFKQTKVAIEDYLVDLILDETHSHPYYTQMLCNFLWRLALEKGEADKALLDQAIMQVMNAEKKSFQNTWDLLPHKQKLALLVLATQGSDSKLFSKSILPKFQFSSADGLAKAFKGLHDKDILEKDEGQYIIEDIFFEKWLRMNAVG